MAETSKQPDPPPPPQAADEGKKEKTDVTPPADEDQKEIEAKMAAEKKLKAYKKEMPKEIPAWLKNNNSEKARLKAQEARTGIKSKWRDKLFYGEVYEGKKEKWTVDKQIVSGGFGDVYAVKLPDSSKLYAMKTEQCDGEYRMLRLKIDVQVLLAVSKETNEQRKKHFVELFDRGAFGGKFKFLVMTLVGPSIDEVRRNTLEDPTKPSGYPCFAKTPVEYAEMIEMIDNYDFFDRPDYKRLMEMIDELARKNGISLTDELDWVAKPKKADDKVQPKKDDEFQPKSDDAGERSVDKCRRKRTKGDDSPGS